MSMNSYRVAGVSLAAVLVGLATSASAQLLTHKDSVARHGDPDRADHDRHLQGAGL